MHHIKSTVSENAQTLNKTSAKSKKWIFDPDQAEDRRSRPTLALDQTLCKIYNPDLMNNHKTNCGFMDWIIFDED